mmetsp:Transcript_5489/g.19331  ORF Transcript_5489/g.19331 Transcript_5489/m.19331 type:complete len:216 (+) Transcript_5489:256-903(+)
MPSTLCSHLYTSMTNDHDETMELMSLPVQHLQQMFYTGFPFLPFKPISSLLPSALVRMKPHGVHLLHLHEPLLTMCLHVVDAAHVAHAGVRHHHHLVAVVVARVAFRHGLQLLDVRDDVLAVRELPDGGKMLPDSGDETRAVDTLAHVQSLLYNIVAIGIPHHVQDRRGTRGLVASDFIENSRSCFCVRELQQLLDDIGCEFVLRHRHDLSFALL